jgi:hypothetical protein
MCSLSHNKLSSASTRVSPRAGCVDSPRWGVAWKEGLALNIWSKISVVKNFSLNSLPRLTPHVAYASEIQTEDKPLGW